MTNQEAIELIENEIGCVMDADNGCDRDCGKCNRVRKSEDIQQAFRMAIKVLENSEYKDDAIKQQEEIIDEQKKSIDKLVRANNNLSELIERLKK